MPGGAGLSRPVCGKVLPYMPAFQPYRGKPAVRNDREGRGNVGIIRSPVRASTLPDCGGREVTRVPTANRCGGRVVCCTAYVGSWHISDMADALANVCYRGEDRTLDAPAAMSQFDPGCVKTRFFEDRKK